MEVFVPDELPVIFEIGRATIRSAESSGMTVTFYRLPAGSDGRPLLQGLPGGSCHCPHWARVAGGDGLDDGGIGRAGQAPLRPGATLTLGGDQVEQGMRRLGRRRELKPHTTRRRGPGA